MRNLRQPHSFSGIAITVTGNAQVRFVPTCQPCNCYLLGIYSCHSERRDFIYSCHSERQACYSKNVSCIEESPPRSLYHFRLWQGRALSVTYSATSPKEGGLRSLRRSLICRRFEKRRSLAPTLSSPLLIHHARDDSFLQTFSFIIINFSFFLSG